MSLEEYTKKVAVELERLVVGIDEEDLNLLLEEEETIIKAAYKDSTTPTQLAIELAEEHYPDEDMDSDDDESEDEEEDDDSVGEIDQDEDDDEDESDLEEAQIEEEVD